MGDWDFQISDQVKKTLYLTPVKNFGEVRRAQSAKSTLLTSTLEPLGSFRPIKMLKRLWGVESNRKLITPVHP